MKLKPKRRYSIKSIIKEFGVVFGSSRKMSDNENFVTMRFRNPSRTGSYCYWPEHNRMKCSGVRKKEAKWFRGYFMREYWSSENSSNDLAPWWVDRMKKRVCKVNTLAER